MQYYLVSYMCPECEVWHDMNVFARSADEAFTNFVEDMSLIAPLLLERISMIAVSEAVSEESQHGEQN